MKAELPNKIGLDSRSVFFKKPNKSGLTEYARTDAFIEKAKEYIYEQLNEGCIECGDIERFVENMETYMKGE